MMPPDGARDSSHWVAVAMIVLLGLLGLWRSIRLVENCIDIAQPFAYRRASAGRPPTGVGSELNEFLVGFVFFVDAPFSGDAVFG